MGARLQVESLRSDHDRANFSSGAESLDAYLQRQAGQDLRRRVAAAFVAVSPPSPQVLGYYTLSAASVDLAKIPAEIAKSLPRYPHVPVTLLGRLAVDRGRQGEGLGELLLIDALRRSLAQTPEIGSVAVVVDALNRAAADFYARYGFSPLTDRGDRLIMPMARIATAFAAGR